MPRIPAITTRDQVPTDGQAAFDYVVASRGFARSPFNIMLYSPEFAQRVAHLGAHVFELPIPHALRRIAILAAVRENDCNYEWGVWTAAPPEEGLRPEVIGLIADRAPLSAFTDEEAVIVRFVRELLNDKWVSQPTFDAARAIFGDQGLVEVVGAIGYFTMIGLTMNCFEIESLPQHKSPPPWKST